jgi:hypothetical protein
MDFCPCPMGGDTKKKLVEMSPFREAGSGSDEEAPPPTFADKAKGWFAAAASPLQSFREGQAKAAAKAEREAVLKAGASMKLLPDGREAPKDVRITLSSDSSMLTWSGGGASGVMALSAVRDVKPVLASGFFKSGGPVPCQWMLVADDQTVRFEARTDEEKTQWMETLEACVGEQLDAKSGRKVRRRARRCRQPRTPSRRALPLTRRPHRAAPRRASGEREWPVAGVRRLRTRRSGSWGWRRSGVKPSDARRRCSRRARREA